MLLFSDIIRTRQSHDTTPTHASLESTLPEEICRIGIVILVSNSVFFLPYSKGNEAMAKYDDNPFAGDSENPFAVSVLSQQACSCRMINSTRNVIRAVV